MRKSLKNACHCEVIRRFCANLIAPNRHCEALKTPKQSTPNRHNERSEVSKGRESKKLDSHSL